MHGAIKLGISVIDLANKYHISNTTAVGILLDFLYILYAKMSPLITWTDGPIQIFLRNKFECKGIAIFASLGLFIDQGTIHFISKGWSGRVSD